MSFLSSCFWEGSTYRLQRHFFLHFSYMIEYLIFKKGLLFDSFLEHTLQGELIYIQLTSIRYFLALNQWLAQVKLKIEVHSECLEIQFSYLLSFLTVTVISESCLQLKYLRLWKKKHHVLGIFSEEHSRLNVLHQQPVSFRWFISGRRSKAKMEFSVTAYK